MISQDILLKQHNMFSIVMLIVCIAIPYFGYHLKKQKTKNIFSFFLISFAIIQEILDYINRIFIDNLYFLSWDQDLPFHLCHFGFYFSLVAIFLKCYENNISSKRIQYLFDISFAIGFSGALQGILTVDFTGINNTLGVIYIVRDPRNIITSLIHHYSLESYENALEFLFDEQRFSGKLDIKENYIKQTEFPIFISNWKNHYNSWKKFQKEMVELGYLNH